MNTPTPETLARALDAACETLGTHGCAEIGRPDCDENCADCWRRYLLAQAEQERDEG